MFQPIRSNREFRLLYSGQLVSFLGTMVSVIAVPQQIFEITQSSKWVGYLSLAQLIPVFGFSLIGGSYSDRMDRKKLLVWTELFMGLATLGLLLNHRSGSPSVGVIFFLSAIIQAANGFHRPALEAATQQVLSKQEYAGAISLRILRNTLGSILGPSLGGILYAWGGADLAYLFDAFTFLLAALSLGMMKDLPPPVHNLHKPIAQMITEALMMLKKMPLVWTSYLVDIVAMIFAFPVALFPAIGTQFDGAKSSGLLFSAMSAGALLSTWVSSKLTLEWPVGRMLFLSAAFWGLGIAAMPIFPNHFYFLAACLALAGFLDGVNASCRNFLWAHEIPSEMRGRFAGIEMLSYLCGPMLGNIRSGWVAEKTTVSFALGSGGLICFGSVLALASLSKELWKYPLKNKVHD